MLICCLARNPIASTFPVECSVPAEVSLVQEEEEQRRQEEYQALEEAHRAVDEDETFEEWKREREQDDNSSENWSDLDDEEDSISPRSDGSCLAISSGEREIEQETKGKEPELNDLVNSKVTVEELAKEVKSENAGKRWLARATVSGIHSVPLVMNGVISSRFGEYNVEPSRYEFHSSNVFFYQQSLFSGIPLQVCVYPEVSVIDCILSILQGRMPNSLFAWDQRNSCKLFTINDKIKEEKIATPSFSPGPLRTLLESFVHLSNQYLRLSRIRELLRWGLKNLQVFPYGQCYLETAEEIHQIVVSERVEISQLHVANCQSWERLGFPVKEHSVPSDHQNCFRIDDLFRTEELLVSLLDIKDWANEKERLVDTLENILWYADEELWDTTKVDPACLSAASFHNIINKGCRHRTAQLLDTFSDFSENCFFISRSNNLLSQSLLPKCEPCDKDMEKLLEFYESLRTYRESDHEIESSDKTLHDIAWKVMTLFFVSLRPYLRIMDSWVYEGNEIDAFQESSISLMTSQTPYHIVQNPEVSFELEEDCPKVFKSFLNLIMTSGHTVRLLRKLTVNEDTSDRIRLHYRTGNVRILNLKEETQASVHDITLQLRGNLALWQALCNRIHGFLPVESTRQLSYPQHNDGQEEASDDPYLTDVLDFCEMLPKQEYHLDHVEQKETITGEDKVALDILDNAPSLEICLSWGLGAVLREHSNFVNAHLAVLLLGDLDLVRYLRILKGISFMAETSISGELCHKLFKAIANGRVSEYHDSNNLTQWLHSAIISQQNVEYAGLGKRPETVVDRDISHIPEGLQYEFNYHLKNLREDFVASDVDTETVHVQLSTYDK